MDAIIKKDRLENVNFFANKFLGVNILRGGVTQITVGLSIIDQELANLLKMLYQAQKIVLVVAIYPV